MKRYEAICTVKKHSGIFRGIINNVVSNLSEADNKGLLELTHYDKELDKLFKLRTKVRITIEEI